MNKRRKPWKVIAIIAVLLAVGVFFAYDYFAGRIVIDAAPDVINTAEAGIRPEEYPAPAASYRGGLTKIPYKKLKASLKQVDGDTSMPGHIRLIYEASFRDKSEAAVVALLLEDRTPPALTLKTREGYVPNSFLGYIDEGAEAVDIVDGDLSDKIETEWLDETHLKYSVTDAAGNEASIVREISFTNSRPTLALIGEEGLSWTGLTPYVDPGFTALDEYGNDFSALVQVDSRVNVLEAGEYEYRYVLDLGDVAPQAAIRKVTVVNPIVPDIIIPEQKTIYLTFDDGPSPYTEELLDILAKYNVKATFMVLGYKMQNRPETIQRMIRDGHVVGLHSWSHVFSKCYASDAAFWAEIEKENQLLYDLTGTYTRIIRFPGGSSNTTSKAYSTGIMTRLVAQAKERGYVYFDWNLSTGDGGGTSTENVIYYYKKSLTNERKNSRAVVVLLHDCFHESVKAVEELILWGQENGYVFAPLDVTSNTAKHRIFN